MLDFLCWVGFWVSLSILGGHFLLIRVSDTYYRAETKVYVRQMIMVTLTLCLWFLYMGRHL